MPTVEEPILGVIDDENIEFYFSRRLFVVQSRTYIRAKIDANISVNSEDKLMEDTGRILHSFKTLRESKVYNLI